VVKRIYPYRKHKRFYNYKYHHPESFFFGSIPSFLHTIFHRTPPTAQHITHWVDTQPVIQRSITPLITWIGHATFLIQLGGINIITDPIFTEPSLFYTRLTQPGILFEQLPPIDIVLISHNHHDHMHAPTLERIRKRNETISFLVPEGDKVWFQKREYHTVHEFMWWEKHTTDTVGSLHDVVCTFLPAFHWSGRGLSDRNRSLWGSWLITYNDRHIYFGGDTAYGPHFSQIGTLFDQIDVALLPIAPGEPFKWMRHTHMNGAQAVQACIALRARHFVPMHWATFAMGCQEFMEPLNQVDIAWNEYHDLLRTTQRSILKIGQKLSL
jgi:L-ascorbate metabolism protein UlaG (beta-lactamase superfamily)